MGLGSPLASLNAAAQGAGSGWRPASARAARASPATSPEAVALAKRLARKRPKGRKMSLRRRRRNSAALATARPLLDIDLGVDALDNTPAGGARRLGIAHRRVEIAPIEE